MKLTNVLPTHLQNFLKIATPIKWCEAAIDHFELLLIDHVHCERKGAASALQLITKNPHQEHLIRILSPIAREELLHFEKMLRLLKKRNIKFQPLASCDYGKKLHACRAKGDNQLRLIDDLIIAAIIEARSCERFFSLLPFIQSKDTEIFKFYSHLANAEQRHFEVYIEYARKLSGSIDKRLDVFLTIENEHILSRTQVFRFHGGILE
jgi:tRNA-(ms[2]io[6]A)-hydroxylase